MSLVQYLCINKNTAERLVAHGLTLSIQKEVHAENPDYMDEIGEFKGYVDKHRSVAGYMEAQDTKEACYELMAGRCGISYNDLEKNVIWRPIYDIGLTGVDYTTKQSEKTGWITLHGVIFQPWSELADEFGLDVVLTAEQEIVEQIVEERFEAALKKISAIQNDSVYYVEVKAGDGTWRDGAVKAAQSFDYSNDEGIDSVVNNLIDIACKKIDESKFKVDIYVADFLIATGLNPLAYTNKSLDRSFGFQLTFGTPSFNAETGILSVCVKDNLMPTNSKMSDLTNGHILEPMLGYQKANQTDSALRYSDHSRDCKNLLQLLATNLLGPRDRLLELAAILDYVEGVSVASNSDMSWRGENNLVVGKLDGVPF